MILQFVSEFAPDVSYSLEKIENHNTHTICKPEDVVSFFGDFFSNKKQEYLCTLNLDASNTVISARIITIGLINHSPAHPREVFRDAIIDGSVSIIMCHNHPSGRADPSIADINITRDMINAGAILGIEVRDHVIIGDNDHWTSMKQLGVI